MVRRLMGLCLLIIPLFFGFAMVKAIIGLPETNEMLKDAVMVSDGLVHAENEGKRVAAVFHFDMFNDAEDSDMSIRFHSPFVRRYVQILKYDGTEYRWQTVGSYAEEWLKDAAFMGTVQEGETLIIDDSLLISIGASKQAEKKHIYEEDYNRLADSVYVVDYNTQTWFSEAPSWLMDDSDKGSAMPDEYAEYEGSRRIRYNIIEPNKNEVITVVGIQQGNDLIKDQSLDTYPVFDSDSVEGIGKENNRNVIVGMLVVMVLCLPLAYYGFRMFMDK